ncbi:MAG: hypothetical protein ACMUIU_01680 [bacterium]
MQTGYSPEVYRELEKKLLDAQLYRPMSVSRYEAGDRLNYEITDLICGNRGKVCLVIDKFIGGGFAGQVYRVILLDIETESDSMPGLREGGVYAMKILIPPTAFSRLFRNTLYWIGFQGPFQLQVNPIAARAGALWQKFIRRGAKICFGDETTVVDIYATFIDSALGSCGELSEWIDGRTWRLEVDDHVDLLSRWRKGKDLDDKDLGSPEYRAKHSFMYKFVDLLHNMGCHEFARQYEWYTCKSQPNCLKRKNNEGSASDGLVAVDFRAGLALLPFLPMSPGDFKLIAEGICRGSLVQFDRGDVDKLEQFVNKHSDEFTDMQPLLEELKQNEMAYRDSVPDITHNHFRLLYSSRLWSTMLGSAVTVWKIRNLVDETGQEKLKDNKSLILLFLVIGFIPLIGRFLRRIWGHENWRRHYLGIMTNYKYLRRTLKAKIAEMCIGWLRAGRIDERNAIKVSESIWRFSLHLPLSILPVGLHRFLTDPQYARDRIIYFTVRPVRLYFNAELREEWLREMVAEGRKKHLLSNDDEEIILSKVDEPFIQKYLKSLAVHVCTLPVTQIVSVMIAIIYVLMHPEMPRAQSWGVGLGIIALFQVVPISPGSLVRGLYVLYLVISERNFRDYNIAVFLGFFKYVGYLAFPIQMTYRYPTIARFMAAHWATEAVHIVPVFGERGALLEHGVFCLFYNWPLTIRRRMRTRAEIRTSIQPRYWHIILCSIIGAGIFGIVDFVYLASFGKLPGLNEVWWLSMLLPFICGSIATLGSGGAHLSKRIIGAALCGVVMGVFYTAISAFLGYGGILGASDIVISGVWRIFLFTIFSAIGAILTELKLPEPKIV